MAKIPKSDSLRSLLGAGALSDLTKGIEVTRSLEGSIFPKATTLRGVLAPLDEEVLRRASGADLIGTQLRDTLAQANAAILGRGIGASAALSAGRINTADYGLKFGSLRIAELYGAQSGVGKLFEGWKLPLQEFGLGLDRFVEEQQRLDERTNDFVQAHGWPVPLNLPIRAYRHLVGMVDAGKREVNGLMTRSFRPGTRVFASTKEVLLESPQLRSRRPLIKQALSAFGRRDWYLVINGLLPLVEGVLVDYAFQAARAPEWSRTKKALGELREKEDASLGVAIDTLETMLHSAGANIALFESFSQANYGGPGEPRSLNRNAILHGAARRYGSEQNALRLMLLVAVMAEAFDLSESLA